MDRKPSPLEVWRTAHSKTQADLAELLGTTQATISRWETGENQIPPLATFAIAAATGIPRAELLEPVERARGAA